MSDEPTGSEPAQAQRTPRASGRRRSSGDAGGVVETQTISALGAVDIRVLTSRTVPANDLPGIEIKEREDRITENSWRRWAIGSMLGAFIGLNVGVFVFLFIVWLRESSLPSGTRIVTERVMLALIAGSVTQLGALALTLGRALARREN